MCAATVEEIIARLPTLESQAGQTGVLTGAATSSKASLELIEAKTHHGVDLPHDVFFLCPDLSVLLPQRPLLLQKFLQC